MAAPPVKGDETDERTIKGRAKCGSPNTMFGGGQKGDGGSVSGKNHILQEEKQQDVRRQCPRTGKEKGKNLRQSNACQHDSDWVPA